MKIPEHNPGIDPGIVEIVELQADCIISNRLNADNPDMAAPCNQDFAAWAMALDLCRRILHAQQLGLQGGLHTVIPGYLQHLGRLIVVISSGQGRKDWGFGPVIVQLSSLVHQHDRQPIPNGIGETRGITDRS